MRYLVALSALMALSLVGDEIVGERPYEMEWAGRTADPWTCLVDFEEPGDWTVEATNTIASFERTREQQMYGSYVGKLTYRRDGTGVPSVVIRPPKPIPVPGDVATTFDMVGCWIYGNNWGWSVDKTTPQVQVTVLFQVPGGDEIGVRLVRVNWKEWFLPLVRLDESQAKALNVDGVAFNGFMVADGRNEQDRTLYFDSLTVHKEEFKPLTFKPRPRRGIPMFPGQGSGANTGSGKLPFPTRPETILPDSAGIGSTNSLALEGEACVFTYRGKDGVLTYRYEPKNGGWDDLTACWNGGTTFQPLFGGGALFPTEDWNNQVKGLAPDRHVHLGTRLKGGVVTTSWQCHLGDKSFEVTYTLSIKGKTLVIDTRSTGGELGAVGYGGVKGLPNQRSILIPYYNYSNGRPGVILSGDAESPLFVSGHTCWYLSNASAPWGRSQVDSSGIGYMNGGTVYYKKTDGKRNDCHDRFFVTVSPEFSEHLPNIPNPKSPWKHVTGKGQWRAHGAGNRERDMAYWRNIWRHGIRDVVVTDHETCWRDGGESFTFRTKPAPKKGGDQGLYDYSRFMQDELGFVYGPYNNFTDFAPVNEYWRTDLISRTRSNQLQGAWMRCYAPKPQYAVEYCAELSPINQSKFKFSTAYCDVHTSVTPWGRCDYDYRVPGAGTFAATFYAFGEIMLHQKAAWNGPVYSEGPHHCFYSGLTDGNYAQDQNYNFQENPWLVDFDLLKMHEQECNFGMGNMEMFYGRNGERSGVHNDLDRFLCATLAFGHPGFLVSSGGMRCTMRGYFMILELHKRYTQASVASIEYADADGKLHPTSRALANDAYKRSQLAIRYSDGTRLVVNGSKDLRMNVKFGGRDLDLPPHGYAGWTEDGKIEVISAERNGCRFDYAVTPEYVYIDGRDLFFQRFPEAAGIGSGVARKIDAKAYEFIPFKDSEIGWSLPIVRAIGLDEELGELGEAKLRRSRGLTYVMPMPSAMSYRLELGEVGGEDVPLRSSLDVVAPGERVIVEGKQRHEFTAPGNVRSGDRIWQEFEGKWIDFTVQDIVSVSPTLTQSSISFALRSSRPDVTDVTCEFGGKRQVAALSEGVETNVLYDLPGDLDEGMRSMELVLSCGVGRQSYTFGLLSEMKPVPYSLSPLSNWESRLCIRGESETSDFSGTGAYVSATTMPCGMVSKSGLFMHPPYKTGVGYTCSIHRFVVPEEGFPVFRGFVGKRDGGDLGDGIWFSVQVQSGDSSFETLAEVHVGKYEWKPIEADLSRWRGREIVMKLVSDVGPEDDSSADWACWGDLRLESRDPQLVHSLDTRNALYKVERPEDFVADLPLSVLGSAKRGWVCYEGQGFNSSPNSYESHGVLNGIQFGLLPASNGCDEVKNIWSPEIRKELTPEALKNVKRFNKFQVLNMAGDYFKLRRFRLVLELADGRTVSSLISTVCVTQPGDWAHAEGVLLPMSETITIPISF